MLCKLHPYSKLSTPQIMENPKISKLIRHNGVHVIEMNSNYTVVEKTGSTDVILELYNEFVTQQCMLQFVKSGRVAVPRDTIENLTELLFNEDYKRKPTKNN